MNIIWPWDARAAVEAYKADADCLHKLNLELELAMREAHLRHKLAEAHIITLNKQLDKAHFRNPKTGRIGKRGVRYS